MDRPFGFGRERRIRRRADFLRVQSQGRRISTPHFILLVAPQTGGVASAARLGLVVTRKIGNAVRRNRIKRVCRACFRTFPAFMPDGADLVVIARAGSEKLGLNEVRAEWTRARPKLLRYVASGAAEGARVPGGPA